MQDLFSSLLISNNDMFLTETEIGKLKKFKQVVIARTEGFARAIWIFFLNRNYFNYFNRTSTVELIFIKKKPE